MLISIAGQLFVEHTSLINIVFAFCVLCYFLVTKATKIKIVLSSIWFGGTVAGMGIMLLIPKLFYVANEWENYQKVNFNSLHDLVISVVANGMQIAGIYLQNVFALIILSIVVITLTNTRKIAKMILLLVPIYGFAVNYIIDDIWDGTICGMISLLLLLLYVMTVVIVIYKEESIAAKMQSLFFIGMSIFAVLPLLVVYPIGSRCLLHSYVFLVLAILSIINNNNAVKVNSNKEIIRLCIVATCLLLCFLTIHFRKIGNIDQARQKYVQDMVVGGAEKIIVPRIPSIYIRENNGWSYGQVFYCEEKQDVAFEFVDYNTWKINIGEEIYGRYLE